MALFTISSLFGKEGGVLFIGLGFLANVISKTKGNFQIRIIEPIQEILDYYKEHPSKTNYIFPILLKENLMPSQIENRKNKVLKQREFDITTRINIVV